MPKRLHIFSNEAKALVRTDMQTYMYGARRNSGCWVMDDVCHVEAFEDLKILKRHIYIANNKNSVAFYCFEESLLFNILLIEGNTLLPLPAISEGSPKATLLCRTVAFSFSFSQRSCHVMHCFEIFPSTDKPKHWCKFATHKKLFISNLSLLLLLFLQLLCLYRTQYWYICGMRLHKSNVGLFVAMHLWMECSRLVTGIAMALQCWRCKVGHWSL